MVARQKSEKNVLRGVTPGEQEKQREIETTLQHEGLVAHPMDRVHQMEQRLHHHLTNHPKYQFSDLVVHRIPNGVCLEGRLYADKDAPDLNAEIYRVVGRCRVVNHIVVCDAAEPTQGSSAAREELRFDAPHTFFQANPPGIL